MPCDSHSVIMLPPHLLAMQQQRDKVKQLRTAVTEVVQHEMQVDAVKDKMDTITALARIKCSGLWKLAHLVSWMLVQAPPQQQQHANRGWEVDLSKACKQKQPKSFEDFLTCSMTQLWPLSNRDTSKRRKNETLQAVNAFVSIQAANRKYRGCPNYVVIPIDRCKRPSVLRILGSVIGKEVSDTLQKTQDAVQQAAIASGSETSLFEPKHFSATVEVSGMGVGQWMLSLPCILTPMNGAVTACRTPAQRRTCESAAGACRRNWTSQTAVWLLSVPRDWLLARPPVSESGSCKTRCNSSSRSVTLLLRTLQPQT
jgi:hypothetical protein